MLSNRHSLRSVPIELHSPFSALRQSGRQSLISQSLGRYGLRRALLSAAIHRMNGSQAIWLALACFRSLGEFALIVKASCTASQGRSAQKSVGWSCRVWQANSQRSFTRSARGGKVEALLVFKHQAVPERAAQPFNQPDCLRQPVISNVRPHRSHLRPAQRENSQADRSPSLQARPAKTRPPSGEP